MTVVVEGLYQHGKIELLQAPEGIARRAIRLIMISQEPTKPPPRMLTFGMFGGGVETTLEDFKDAEWHGEEEFDDLYGQ